MPATLMSPSAIETSRSEDAPEKIARAGSRKFSTISTRCTGLAVGMTVSSVHVQPNRTR